MRQVTAKHTHIQHLNAIWHLGISLPFSSNRSGSDTLFHGITKIDVL